MINPPRTLPQLQLLLLQTLENFSAISIALLPCRGEIASLPTILLETNHAMVSHTFILIQIFSDEKKYKQFFR